MIKVLSSADLRNSRTASASGSRKQGTARPGHGNDPARTAPAFSWISPNLCDDGHDVPCVTGAPGGLAQAGAFVPQRVPKIMAASHRDGQRTLDDRSRSAGAPARASIAAFFAATGPTAVVSWTAPAAPVHPAAVRISMTFATFGLFGHGVAGLSCRCYGW